MKSFSTIMVLLVASSMAFGATTKKIKRVIYEDGSSSTTTISAPKAYDQDRIVRRIIPEIGLVIGDITVKTSGTRTGLNVGVLTDLLGAHELVLESGLLYRQLGTYSNGITEAVNYLTVPISAKYYLFGQQANTVYFKGGVTPGINVAASESNDAGTSKSISDQINTFDFGLLLAVGGKYNFTRQLAVVLEAYYNRGLTNVMNVPGGGNGVPSVNTLAYGLSTGFSVEL